MTESSRYRMSPRRDLETISVEHESQRYKISLGRDFTPPDVYGPVLEVFVNAQKVNSPVDVLVSDGAILMSLLLQYGHPAEEIAASLKRNPDGLPASPLGIAARLITESK